MSRNCNSNCNCKTKRILLPVVLTVLLCLFLSSCDIIRKYEAPQHDAAETEEEQRNEENVADDFPDGADSSDASDETVRYTEKEARSLLLDSFTEEEKETVTVDAGSDMTAQSNGTEYYIFTAEKEPAEEGGEPEKLTYYVSTNATIYTSLEENNANVSEASKLFCEKNGEKDGEGRPYRVEYVGLVMNIDSYCYNFEVYVGEGENSVYKTNFLVSLDGHSYGEQALR